MVNIMLIQKVLSDAFKTSEIVYWSRICDPSATYMGIDDIGALSNVPITKCTF